MLDHAPAWLPGGHAQTIWPALYAKRRWGPKKPLLRERWATPDGDFLDVDKQAASRADRPLLVLFHGLEGSSDSHYAQAFADWAAEQDVNFALPHFRGCSGELNHAPRAYHSGDHEEIDWLLKRLRQEHQACGGQKMMAAGVSLGGNALMRWAAENGHQLETSGLFRPPGAQHASRCRACTARRAFHHTRRAGRCAAVTESGDAGARSGSRSRSGTRSRCSGVAGNRYPRGSGSCSIRHRA